VVEESPAPGLSDAVRGTLHDAARRAALALGYRNAGTVEFLVDPRGRVFFLEVNRRLQVEHPVTEEVHGLDLVAWQLRIAAGEALPPEGAWPARGHAVEARVCAEDPERGFLPSPGTVLRAREPSGPGIRVDSGLRGRGAVPPHYDSLLFKVIAHGATREEAVGRLDRALEETAVVGVASNVPFLRRVLASEEFRSARLSTDLLERPLPPPRGGEPTAADALLAAAAADLLGVGGQGAAGAGGGAARPDPWRALAGWRVRRGAP
jgi:acetyl/propionyl-CoA carboxylase alpha subunit